MFSLLWPLLCAGCGSPGVRLCPECATGELRRLPDMEGLASVHALGPYDGPLGDALRRAKFKPDRRAAWALGACMARYAPPATCVVPAPSTLRRRLQRGFSTAAVLAEAVARAQGFSSTNALSVAAGVPQASLSGRSRRASLQGRVRAVRWVEGPVLLIDDVATTGTTLQVCARELLCAGATSVSALVLCDAHGSFGPDVSETTVQTS